MTSLPNTESQQPPERCGNCRWWQSDRRSGPDPIGLCLHEELAHFQLQVSDDSGCNRFEAAGRPEPVGHSTADR